MLTPELRLGRIIALNPLLRRVELRRELTGTIPALAPTLFPTANSPVLTAYFRFLGSCCSGQQLEFSTLSPAHAFLIAS